MSFTQDMNNLVNDSKLLREYLEDENPEEIYTFFEKYEYELLDKFYTDFRSLSFQEAMEMVNILHKFEFRQEDDFDFYVILRFNLRKFPDYIRKNYLFDLQNDILNNAIRRDFILTFKYKLSISKFNEEKIKEYICAIDNMELIEFIYSIIPQDKRKEIMEYVFLDKDLAFAQWIYNLNIIPENNYVILYLLALLNEKNEIATWLYSLDSVGTFLELHDIFGHLSKEEILELLEYLILDADIDILKAIAANFPIVNELIMGTIFEIMYKNEDLEFLELLLTRPDITDLNIINGFIYSKIKHNSEMEYLMKKTGEINKYNLNANFRSILNTKDIVAIKVLMQTAMISDENIINAISKSLNDNELDIAITLINNGNGQDIAQYLADSMEYLFENKEKYNFLTINMNDSVINKIFLFLISPEHSMYIKKSLLDTGRISRKTINKSFLTAVNISIDNNYGDVDDIELLLNTSQVDKKLVNDAFTIALEYDCQYIIEYLLDTGKISEETINETIKMET